MGDIAKCGMDAVKRYIMDENSLMGGMDMFEDDEGDYVLHSDYAALLARHNALVEAMAWERECYAFHLLTAQQRAKWRMTLDERNDVYVLWKAARAEVDRLLEESKNVNP